MYIVSRSMHYYASFFDKTWYNKQAQKNAYIIHEFSLYVVNLCSQNKQYILS